MLFKTITSICLVVCILAGMSAAAVITVDCDGNDRTWRDDGSAIWIGQRSAGIGYDGSWRETSHMLVFELPDLAGETIESANLEMHVWDSAWGNELSLDLYGVRGSTDGITASSDVYVGAYDTSGTNGTAIMQAYASKIGSSTPFPVNERQVNTDDAADLALGAWLSSLYASGYSAGDFAILRVTPDTDYISGSNSYIYSDTGDTTSIQGNGATYFFVPQLTITTVPEPATLTMLAMGSAVLIRRKK